MEPVSREQLVAAYEGNDDLWIPELESVRWPDLDYFGWVHPSGHLGYIVLTSPNSGDLRLISLQRYRPRPSKPRYEMCAWCHHVHRTNGTAMFSVEVKGSNGRHTLGNVICKDLDCSLQIRNITAPGTYMKETLYLEAKIWRMQMNMHKWLGRAKRL